MNGFPVLTSLRRVSLTGWIFAGMAAGILIGWGAPGFAAELRPLSTMFLRMIKSIVVPIIFGTLVIGIAGHGDDLKRIGRLALKSIGYFWVMTTVALVVGLLAGNLVRPGIGVALPPPDPNAPIPVPAPSGRCGPPPAPRIRATPTSTTSSRWSRPEP